MQEKLLKLVLKTSKSLPFYSNGITRDSFILGLSIYQQKLFLRPI